MSGKLPCHFFAQGRCTKGAACTFSHDPSLKGTATKPHKKPCSFFAKVRLHFDRGKLGAERLRANP
jgi:hypothetical protein